MNTNNKQKLEPAWPMKSKVIEGRVSAQVRVQVGGSVGPQVWQQTNSQVRGRVGYRVGYRVEFQVRDQLYRPIGNELERLANGKFRAQFGIKSAGPSTMN